MYSKDISWDVNKNKHSSLKKWLRVLSQLLSYYITQPFERVNTAAKSITQSIYNISVASVIYISS